MSEIIKTEAVVLSKLNYRETSKIAAFYTKSHGKISAIIRGARTPKSASGFKIDPLNYLQVVIYKKAGRELQLLTQADTIAYYPSIREDLEKLKYASAVLELVQSLTVEGDANQLLFRGIVRILRLMDSSADYPQILLLKFFLFMLKETGYEIQTDHCSVCLNRFETSEPLYFYFDSGIICPECRRQFAEAASFSKELFNFIDCLRNVTNKTAAPEGAEQTRQRCLIAPKEAEKAILFFEKYLNYHIPEFKGIRSIHLF